MTNIHDDEGVLDLAAARERLVDITRTTRRPEEQRRDIAFVQTAALLDIAASLRPLAREVAISLEERDLMYSEIPDDDASLEEIDRLAYPTLEAYAAVGGTADDFLVEGDLVHVIGETEPGEVVKLGITEGDIFADVAFAEAGTMRYYVRNLERLVGDAGDGKGDEPVRPFVGARVWPKGDDGVGIVRGVDDSSGTTLVSISWLPDPRDEDAVPEEYLADDRIRGPFEADGFIFDTFPEGSTTPDEIAVLERAKLAQLNAAADAEGEIDEDDFTPPASALDALDRAEKKPGKKKGSKK